jgi:hypothetical protein
MWSLIRCSEGTAAQWRTKRLQQAARLTKTHR